MENKFLCSINEILEIKKEKKVDKLTLEWSLRDDLGFTSFDLAELTVRIEDEFDVDIFEDGLVDTISEVIAKLK